MNTLFTVFQLFVSTFLFLIAAFTAAGGDWPKATFYMAFACYMVLIFLASEKAEEKK